MEKIIIEVGSTCTKIDLFNENNVKHIGNEVIEFKKNYKLHNKLDNNDVEKLIKIVNKYKTEYKNIYVCGTSIFRNLTEEQKDEFMTLFSDKTGTKFEIIDQKKECELTVLGSVKKIKDKVAVLVGGGGSTEITVYENGIKEMVNTPLGVIDIMNKYPDLAENFATTDIETIKKYIKSNLNLPKEKADILILSGGGHLYFALNSGINYQKNNLYEDSLQPVMMDIETRKKDTTRYYKEISLDKIREKTEDPNWWYATRAMCAVVIVVAEEIGAKYIVPTDISMVYGLTEVNDDNTYNDINFSDMMKMQKELWEVNKEKWSPMEAKYGRNFLLWMVEEMGEVISIIKKKGDNAIMENEEVRKAFVEEMSDVLMYYNDTLLRYGITADEISSAYINKHNKNMNRNYQEEYKKIFEKK